MLEHARGHLALYESIVGKERGGFVIRRIHRTIADLAMLDLKAIGFVRPSEQRDLAAQFVAGAFMSVLTWWLDRGAKLPPEEVDGIFRRLTMQGLAAELGKEGLRSARGRRLRSAGLRLDAAPCLSGAFSPRVFAPVWTGRGRGSPLVKRDTRECPETSLAPVSLLAVSFMTLPFSRSSRIASTD